MKVTLKADVAGAGTSSATHTVEAEAFDKIEVTVPGASDVTVDVQPGGAGQVRLVFITAAAYPVADDGTVQLKYAVDGGTAHDLDAPLLAAGGGAVSLLGAVNAITFTNDADEDVAVQVLVGRNAVTP